MSRMENLERDALLAEPSFDIFKTGLGDGQPQLVWTRLVSDLETPVSAMLKLSQNRPMSFLLESVEGGAVRGRYSIIGLEPDIVWRAFGARAEINRAPRQRPAAFQTEHRATLVSLRSLLQESKIAVPAGLPPMSAAGLWLFHTME